MKKFLQSLILFSVLAWVAPAFAANLGTFNATCGPGGVNLAQAITGNVGDTFTVNVLVPAPLALCIVAATTAGIVNPQNGFINAGSNQLFTLAASGATTLTVTQNGFGTTFTVTVNAPAAVTSVPTLSQWGLIILASLMAIFGIAATRRRQD